MKMQPGNVRVKFFLFFYSFLLYRFREKGSFDFQIKSEYLIDIKDDLYLKP